MHNPNENSAMNPPARSSALPVHRGRQGL